MKKNVCLILSVILVLSVLCGCGSSGSSYNYSASPAYAPAFDAAESSSAYGGAYTEAKDEGYYDYDNGYSEEAAIVSENTELSQSAADNEKIITTVNINAETDDYKQFSLWITSRVSSLGGYIEASDEYSNYNGTLYGYLTIRIPAQNLNSFIQEIGDNSNITRKNVTTENVTLTYVDLESRVNTLKTEQQRLMELLEQADTLEDMLTIEDKLAYVRYELESYSSQLRVYDNRINYATIYLNIDEVVEYSEPAPETFGDRVKDGFISTAKSIGTWFEEFTIVLLSSIPALALLAVIVIIVIIIVKVCVKRSRKKRAAKLENTDSSENNIS